ncbi:[Pyruvate dehydrogenase [acetyl-transferring]]-phosphatase 1, mitochondrial, partial [Coemansia sp. RSA 2599]
SIRQRRAFNNTSSEQQQPPQQQQQQQQQQQKQQEQQGSDQQGGGKAAGTKRSLTIAIGGVLTLLGVVSYTFMRSSAPVDQVTAASSNFTPAPTPAQITAALQSVATKRSDAQKELEGLSRKEKREKARQLKDLTDLEVTAILRANEKSWDAIDGALRVDTNQVSSNDPIEDYLTSGDLKAGGGTKYMVGVFDGHAGYMCAEQLSKRMGPMIDSALGSIGGGEKGTSAALNNAVVRLTRNTEHQWDPLSMALTASFIAMDRELVHDALAEFK